MIKNNLYINNQFHRKDIKIKNIKKLTSKFKRKFLEINKDLNNSTKTLNILNKKFKINFILKDLKRFKRYKKIALIGMGGSILGVEAIHDFLKEKIKKKIYFFNDLNENKISSFKKNNELNKVLFIIISKSGNTVETLVNAFSLNIIKKNSKNIIIISEKKNNPLFLLSKKYNLFYVEHKSYIGGRFSVLSEVGLLPAYLMGIQIFKLRSKISSFLQGKEKKFLQESSIRLSDILNSKKISSLVFLCYSPEIEKFLFWCQQLIAESLGKDGKGLLPTVSIVPKDHHSLLQLYLDGPKDKLFHIFSIEKKPKKKVHIKKISGQINYLNNKTLGKVKDAQKNALIKTLTKNKISFREFKIKQTNEQVLGILFSYFILETILIGKLSNINPFDQPSVEQVKTQTKKLLS